MIRRFLTAGLVVVGALTFTGCANSGPSPKLADVKAGAMPEGEVWNGVYFHPLYGYLHLVEENDVVMGRWKLADQSAWGELNGKREGNLVRYTWKQHKVGLVGEAAESNGKGYFFYTPGTEKGIAELKGEFGLELSDSGTPWDCKKQQRMNPDLKSINGDTGGTAPPAANPWQ